MKKVVGVSLAAALFLLGLFFFLKNTHANRDISTAYLLSHIELSISNDGQTINNESFNRYLFYTHLINDPVLVIDYSELGCRQCYQFMMDGLAEQFGDVMQNPRIVFVVSDSYLYEEGEIRGNTIFLPKDEKLGIENNDNLYPLLFVYVGEVRHSFMPDPNAPDVYHQYLNTLRKKYEF